MDIKKGLVGLIFFTGLIVIPFFQIPKSHFEKMERYVSKVIAEETITFDVIVDTYLETANIGFDVVMRQPEVFELMKKAAVESPLQRNQLRKHESLYENSDLRFK